MNNVLRKMKTYTILLGILFAVPFFFGAPKAEAAVLTPGALFATCGEIQAAGTYYLNANISTTTSPACIRITSSGVTISATTSKIISGSVSIVATSTGNDNGYSFTISGAIGVLGAIDASGSGSGTAGTVTYNGTSYNSGTLTGNAIFNGTSFNIGFASATPRTASGSRAWYSIAQSTDGAKMVAVVNAGFIYTSTDYGITWTSRDQSRSWNTVASSADGAKLVATEGGGRIYTSTDSGASWTPRDSNRSWESVASSADGTKLAAVDGNNGYIYTSTNSGVTWTPQNSGQKAWMSIASSADGTKLVAVVQNGTIYTSTDSGVNWTTRDSIRNWRMVASSADGTKLAAVVANGKIYTSADSGVTWTPREQSRTWRSVTASADGTKFAAADNNSGYVYISTDSGVTWAPQTSTGSTAWYSVSFSPDGSKLAAGRVSSFIYTTAMGSVSGNATFTATSYSYGSSTVTVSPQAGTVSGTTSFIPVSGSTVTFNVGTASTTNACGGSRCVWDVNASGYNFGTSTSIVNFYGNAQLATSSSLAANTVAFYNSSFNSGTLIASTTTFNTSSYNIGTVSASSTILLTSAINYGVINGPASFRDSSVNQSAGHYWVSRESAQAWVSTASSADGSKLVALAQNNQIFTSTDSGVTWTARELSRAWYDAASSADGTKLVAVVGGGNIYTSTDSGVTWTARDATRSWYGVASSADGTKLVATVNGGYLYTSTDSGVSWTQRGSGQTWRRVASSADGTKLVAVAVSGNIFTSTDSGVTWTAREQSRTWQDVSSSADGTKLAAVAQSGNIYTSVDSGVTWTSRASTQSWVSIASSADGTKLVAAVNSGKIYVSIDSGVNWTARESNQSWGGPSMSADGTKILYPVINGQLYTSQAGTVVGDAITFNNAAVNVGGITGNATFTGSSYAYSSTTISVSPQAGTVSGTTSFIPVSGSTVTFNVGTASTTNACGGSRCVWDVNASGYNFGTSTSIVNFYGNAQLATSTSLTAASSSFFDSAFNNGTLNASSTFFGGTSYNRGMVTASSTTFSGSAYNEGVGGWVPRDSSRNWYGITSSIDGTKLAAVAYGGKIYTSTDSGLNWTERGTVQSWTSITSSADGTKLAALAYGGQIYTSTDSGLTWTAQASGTRSWWDVASSADGTKLAAVVYGGRIYTSTDSGVSWTAQDTSRNWRSVASSEDGTKLVAVVSNGYIYTSTDSGVTWTARETGTSRGWQSVASSADGTKLVAVVNGGNLYTSTDSGVTWTVRDAGRSWNGVASSADGTKLVAVVTNGAVYQSVDSGVTWTARSTGGAYWADITSSADGARLAAPVTNAQIFTASIGKVTGGVTFNATTYNNGYVIGNATFNTSSYNTGNVADGTATFNNATYNTALGYVAAAVFNATSYNLGTVGGSAKFNTTYYNASAPSGGVFTLSTQNYRGKVFGTLTGSDDAVITSFVFNGSIGNQGDISIPTVTFNDSSYNNSTLTASTTIFNDSSRALSSLTAASTTFNDISYIANNSVITGDAKFTGTRFHTSAPTGGVFTVSSSTWVGRVTGNIYGVDDALITSFEFTGAGSNGGTIYLPATFSGVGYNAGTINTTGGVVFNDSTFNSSSVTAATTTFNNTTYNTGNVFGNAVFNTTFYHTNAPAGGVFAVSTGEAWSGSVSGTIYGVDNAPITSFIFSNDSFNEGTVPVDATFTDSSYNNGTINGNADIYYPAVYPIGGVVVGGITYHDYDIGSYFNDLYTNDGDWNNLSNWWTDDSFTTSASFVPNTTSVVTVVSPVTQNTGNTATAYQVTFDGAAYNGIEITAAGGFIFNDQSFNTGTLNGPVTFTADTYSYNPLSSNVNPQQGSVSGNVVYFIPASGTTTVTFNIGTPGVNDDCNGSTCYWYDNGDPGNWQFGADNSYIPIFNFYGNSYNNGNPEVANNSLGAVNFYDSSHNGDLNSSYYGYTYGNTFFYDYSYNAGSYGYVYGAATFNDDTYNYGEVYDGDATFNDNSHNFGSIYTNAIFTRDVYSYDPNTNNGVNPQEGYVNSSTYFIPASGTTTVTFNIGTPGVNGDCNGDPCYWYDNGDTGNWQFGADNSYTPVFNFYANSYNAGNVDVDTTSNPGSVNFYDQSRNGNSGYGNYGYTYGNTIFNDESYNESSYGYVVGINTVFNDSSYNYGSVEGDATFNDQAFNYNTVNGVATFTADSYSYNLVGDIINPQNGYVANGTYFIPASGTTTVTFNIGTPGVNDDCNGSTCYWYDNGDTGYWYFGADGLGRAIWNFYANSENQSAITVPANSYINFYDYSVNSVGVIGNVDVYYPNSKPFNGSVTGTIRYHGYPAFYFNDQASFTYDGDWNNFNNWFSDEQFTIPAGSVPTIGDDVYVDGDLTQDTSGGPATVQSATFYDGSIMAIDLVVSDVATFKDAAVLDQNLTGNAVFEGDSSYYNDGTLSGTLTRLYTTDTATIRNFTNEAPRNDWIIIAQNAVVDLSGATYSRSTNTFKALGNGSFIMNPAIDGGASVVPVIVANVPANGTTTTKWVPNIDWDTSVTCEYKMDGGISYIALDCGDDGSDIPRPTAASHTLYLRGTDSTGNVTEKTVSFTYDNTVPTYTTCGTDQLDEATRPYYYLAGNVTGNCTATVSTELRGAQSTTTIGYTVNGNIYATPVSGTINGLNIALKNIAVTGTVSASAATIGGVAGNGGNIIIATSTTGTVSADGGATSGNAKNGGNGGTITITNSYAVASSTMVYSRGGNSSSCGAGGNGGTVTLTNTSDYVISNAGGAGTACQSSGGSSGNSGTGQTNGTYTPPGGGGQNNNNNNNQNPSPTTNRSSSSSNYVPFNFSKDTLKIPVSSVKPLALQTLPVFGGTGVNAFSFETILSNFVFAPLPKALEASLATNPSLKKYLLSAGIATAQDLLNLRKKPVPLAIPTNAADIPNGLLLITVDGQRVPVTASFDNERYLVQKATIPANTAVTVSLYPTIQGAVTGKFDDNIYTFKKLGTSSLLSVRLVSPMVLGTYVFTASDSPIPLMLEVVAAESITPPPVIEKVKQQSVWSVMKFW